MRALLFLAAIAACDSGKPKLLGPKLVPDVAKLTARAKPPPVTGPSVVVKYEDSATLDGIKLEYVSGGHGQLLEGGWAANANFTASRGEATENFSFEFSSRDEVTFVEKAVLGEALEVSWASGSITITHFGKARATTSDGCIKTIEREAPALGVAVGDSGFSGDDTGIVSATSNDGQWLVYCSEQSQRVWFTTAHPSRANAR